MRSFLERALAATAVLCLLSPAAAQEKDYRSLAALKAEGVTKCAGAMSAVTRFLHAEDDFAYLNTWRTSNANDHIATTMTAKSYTDGQSLGFVAASPTVNGTCDTTFIQVFVFDDSCAKVRDTVFKEWRYYDDLGKNPLFKDPTADNVSLTLSALAGGCLGMKRGIVFFPIGSEGQASP